jgi:hypothetical protein
MTRPNWPALRRSRSWRVVATTGTVLFLALWQFLVPDGRQRASDDPSDWSIWAWVVVLGLSFPNALVLAVSASRLLWRARRRSVVWAPVAFFLTTAYAFPSLASASGFAMTIVLWSLPIALSISVGFSLCVILFTPTPKVPAPPALDPTGDEEHVYSRDLVQQRPPGKGPP